MDDQRIRELEHQLAEYGVLVKEIPALRNKLAEMEAKMSIVSRLETGLDDLKKTFMTLSTDFSNFKGRIAGALAIASLLIPFLTALSLKVMGMAH